MRRWHKRQYIRGTAEWALREHARGLAVHRGPARQGAYDAVDQALRAVGANERMIYQSEYVNGMNFRLASMDLHMSEATYYRYRGRLMRAVEDELIK